MRIKCFTHTDWMWWNVSNKKMWFYVSKLKYSEKPSNWEAEASSLQSQQWRWCYFKHEPVHLHTCCRSVQSVSQTGAVGFKSNGGEALMEHSGIVGNVGLSGFELKGVVCDFFSSFCSSELQHSDSSASDWGKDRRPTQFNSVGLLKFNLHVGWALTCISAQNDSCTLWPAVLTVYLLPGWKHSLWKTQTVLVTKTYLNVLLCTSV